MNSSDIYRVNDRLLSGPHDYLQNRQKYEIMAQPL